MTEIVLRDLDGETVTRLAERAANNRRPIEQEIADVLRQAMQRPETVFDRRTDAVRLAARAREIAAMTPAGVEQTDSAILVRDEWDK